MMLSAGYSTNLDNIQQQTQDQDNQPHYFPDSVYWMKPKNFILTNKQNLAQGKAVFEKKLFGLSAMRFGGEYWYSYNPLTYNDTLKVLKDQSDFRFCGNRYLSYQ